MGEVFEDSVCKKTKKMQQAFMPSPCGRPNRPHRTEQVLVMHSMPYTMVDVLDRRALLRIAVLSAAAPLAGCRPAAAAPAGTPLSPPTATLRVGASTLATHTTLSAALASIPLSGTALTMPVTILIEPGTYNDRIVISPASPPVKLLALLAADDPDDRRALAALAAAGKAAAMTLGVAPPFPTVTLSHTTPSPYESTVDVAARRCAAAGIRFEHASPSVANNYGVLVREGGSLTLQSCVVASKTGTGLGVEGAAAADGCDFSGCASYGAAGFGEALSLTRCTLTGNKRGGVLARGVKSLGVSGSAVTKNGGPGLDLAAGGEGSPDTALGADCDLSANAGGPARLGNGWAGGEVVGI